MDVVTDSSADDKKRGKRKREKMIAIENDRRVALKATISSTTGAARYGRAQSSHERPAKAGYSVPCGRVKRIVGDGRNCNNGTTKQRSACYILQCF